MDSSGPDVASLAQILATLFVAMTIEFVAFSSFVQEIASRARAGFSRTLLVSMLVSMAGTVAVYGVLALLQALEVLAGTSRNNPSSVAEFNANAAALIAGMVIVLPILRIGFVVWRGADGGAPGVHDTRTGSSE